MTNVVSKRCNIRRLIKFISPKTTISLMLQSRGQFNCFLRNHSLALSSYCSHSLVPGTKIPLKLLPHIITIYYEIVCVEILCNVLTIRRNQTSCGCCDKFINTQCYSSMDSPIQMSYGKFSRFCHRKHNLKQTTPLCVTESMKGRIQMICKTIILVGNQFDF